MISLGEISSSSDLNWFIAIEILKIHSILSISKSMIMTQTRRWVLSHLDQWVRFVSLFIEWHIKSHRPYYYAVRKFGVVCLRYAIFKLIRKRLQVDDTESLQRETSKKHSRCVANKSISKYRILIKTPLSASHTLFPIFGSFVYCCG